MGNGRRVSKYYKFLQIFGIFGCLTIIDMTEDSDLLEYIRIVADHFCPYVEYVQAECNIESIIGESTAPYAFCTRYDAGDISIVSKQGKFDGNIELQKMIRSRRLDSEKLWYLCLWAKDYASTTQEIIFHSSRSDIESLLHELELARIEGKGYKITVKAGNHHSITFTDPSTSDLLCAAISSRLNSMGPFEKAFSSFDSAPQQQFLEAKYQYYLFYRLLSWFLKDKKPLDKSISVITKDEKYFIGVLIYACGLSNNIRFLDYKNYDGSYAQFLNGQLKGVDKEITRKTLFNKNYGLLAAK